MSTRDQPSLDDLIAMKEVLDKADLKPSRVIVKDRKIAEVITRQRASLGGCPVYPPTYIYVDGHLVELDELVLEDDDDDIVAEHESAAYQSLYSALAKRQERENERTDKSSVCKCPRQATFCDCNALDESFVRV